MLKRFSYLIFIFTLFLGQSTFAENASESGGSLFTEPAEDTFLHPDVAFKLDVAPLEDGVIQASFAIEPGHYLYKDRIKFTIEEASEGKIVDVALPDGDMKDDPNFGVSEVYHHSFVAKITTTNAAENVTLKARYQGCSEKGLCYAPQIKTYDLNVIGGIANGNTANTSNSAASQFDGSQDKTTQALQSGNLWLVISLFFIAGVLLSFTPCVLPMIPILSSIILNSQSQQSKPTKMHAFGLSVAYVLGMSLTYTLLGIAAGLTGNLFSQALQNAWALSITALIFVALAFSMFGFYELKLPSALENKVLNTSQQLKGGEFIGVFLMGALSALVVSPCVAAPLAGALIYIGQSRDVFLGGAGLFALALGMGVPLLLIGASAGSILPKAGKWMTVVRNFFGVLMVLMAAYLVWPVLPNSIKAPVNKVLGFTTEHALPFKQVQSVATLDTAIENANGKLVMLDFYADWCTSCKEMEKLTFSNADVRAALKDVVVLQADVTDNNADHQALLKRFNLFGPPGIIFFNGAGEELPIKLVGYENATKFLARVKHAKTL